LPKNKLSPAQVTALRRSYAQGNVTQTELAAQYGIHKGQVSRIVRGKSGAVEPVISQVFQRILDGLR
jgi:DNA-binding MarR family transcriptional regulator